LLSKWVNSCRYAASHTAAAAEEFDFGTEADINATTKIQANFRGGKARAEVKDKKKKKTAEVGGCTSS
jgi:hypothetical protein